MLSFWNGFFGVDGRYGHVDGFVVEVVVMEAVDVVGAVQVGLFVFSLRCCLGDVMGVRVVMEVVVGVVVLFGAVVLVWWRWSEV